MAVSTMTEMWKILQAYTYDAAGNERPVNQNNEWGGFSRRLNMPVFTGWSDRVKYDKETKTTTGVVSDTTSTKLIGLNNQERWLSHAEKHNDGIAAFFVIHAVDTNADPRKIESIDDGRVFVGKIIRDGTKTRIIGKATPL